MFEGFSILTIYYCLILLICLSIFIYLIIKIVSHIIKTILQFYKILKTHCSEKSYPTKIMFLVNLGISSILTSATILYIKKKQFFYLAENMASNSTYKKIINSTNYFNIDYIFAYIGIFTLLFALPIYILYILDKKNSLTDFQWIKVFIIYCSLIYISMEKYSISIVFCSFLSFFGYWFSISLLYNLIVLARKKIYDWLYDVSNSKPRKPKTNKKLNVSKLTLLWTIIVFILGIIFNIKK